MIGWPVDLKWTNAWACGESSQQPTCPHDRQTRRATHFSPSAMHSSHPSVRGDGLPTRWKCSQRSSASGLSFDSIDSGLNESFPNEVSRESSAVQGSRQACERSLACGGMDEPPRPETVNAR